MLACAAPLRQFERYNVFKRRLERERESKFCCKERRRRIGGGR